MTLSEMAIAVAENLNIIAADHQTVVSNQIDLTSIYNKINRLYREEIFPLISDKFPNDFIQRMYPQNTFTVQGVVDATYSTNTLVSTTNIFDNTMETFQVEITDPVSGETIQKVRLKTFVSPTEFELEEDLPTGLSGDVIFVLGNEFSFGGDVADIKEVLSASIKYNEKDIFRKCEYREKRDVISYGAEWTVGMKPLWYLTSIRQSGANVSSIGFLPFPTSHDGAWAIEYIARPAFMSANDEPRLNIQGVSETLINGATAWGFRIFRMFQEATVYEGLYVGTPGDKMPSGKAGLIKNYKPKTRQGPTKLRLGSYYQGMASRTL